MLCSMRFSPLLRAGSPASSLSEYLPLCVLLPLVFLSPSDPAVLGIRWGNKGAPFISQSSAITGLSATTVFGYGA
jgi:hypothetical protein